jgi:hypothetical protein
MSDARVMRPALSQLMAVNISQYRSTWRCARNGQSENTDRFSRLIDPYHRNDLFNQNKNEAHHGRSPTLNPNPKGPIWGWGVWRSRLGFSDLYSGREKSLWDSDQEHLYNHMELLSKQVEADPYTALFGRRLNPFLKLDKPDTSFKGFFQSFMNTQKHTHVRIVKLKKKQKQKQKGSNSNHVGLQYDPISGRMVPMPPSASVLKNEDAKSDSLQVVDCSPGSEAEANLVSSPSLLKDRQFQPGNSKLQTGVSLGSYPIFECPPGSELDALFRSTLAPYRDGSTSPQIPNETTKESDVSIDCSPESQLRSFFLSESIQSEYSPPRTSKDMEPKRRLNAYFDLESGTNVDCSPGSELEANLIFGPASRLVHTLPSGLEYQRSSGLSNASNVSSLGNELDAKFLSELVSPNSHHGNTSHQENTPSVEASSHASSEYPPGNEIISKTYSEFAGKDISESRAQATVDCTPGSELEAKLLSTPPTASDVQPKLATEIELGSSSKAEIPNQCEPGNGLETKLISDVASAESSSEAESQGTLQASDIHTQYASENRVGEFVLQQHKLATENGSQSPSRHSLPEFHILAYDASTSQVTTAQASSFFDINESVQLSEILSQLHHAAKFLPYLEELQQNGYEIVTGGGDILVFRQTHNNSPLSSPHNTCQAENEDLQTSEGIPAESSRGLKVSRQYTVSPGDFLTNSPSRLQP